MKKIKIIVVDDREVFKKALRIYLLKFEDFEVIAEASDGMAFLDLLNHADPDIVIMDIVMPRMDGIEATKKALKKKPSLKIIALTTFEDIEYRESMMNAGACAYLRKDSVNEKLENMIREFVKPE